MESTVNNWVTYLYKASVYSYYIEEQIKKKNGNLSEITEISSKTILSKAEQSEIIEIKDEVELTEDDDPLKYYNKPFGYDIPITVQENFKTRQNKFDPFMPSIKEFNHLHKAYSLKNETAIIVFGAENNLDNEEKSSTPPHYKFSESVSLSFKPSPIIEIHKEEEKIGFKSFVILKTLGSGSFGKVFLVNNPN